MNLRASRKTWLLRALPITAAAALVAGITVALAPSASAAVPFAVESLDGSGNNVGHPTWGQAGQPTPGSARPSTPTASASRSAGPNAR